MADEELLMSYHCRHHNGYGELDQIAVCRQESISSADIVRYTATVGLDYLRIYDVAGMHCYQCAENVRKLLVQVDGVLSAEVSLKMEKALVKFTDKKSVSADELTRALADEGFLLTEA